MHSCVNSVITTGPDGAGWSANAALPFRSGDAAGVNQLAETQHSQLQKTESITSKILRADMTERRTVE